MKFPTFDDLPFWLRVLLVATALLWLPLAAALFIIVGVFVLFAILAAEAWDSITELLDCIFN